MNITKIFSREEEQENIVLKPNTIKDIEHYCQSDPKWDDVIMNRRKRLEESGCALTCLAMLGTYYYGKECTPITLDKYFDEHKGWHGELVIWDTFSRYVMEQGNIIPLKYDYVQYDQIKPELIKIKINKGVPLIFGVGYHNRLPINHFVVCIGYNDKGEYIIHDPGTKHGDGYKNVIENTMPTKRQGGYKINRMAFFE